MKKRSIAIALAIGVSASLLFRGWASRRFQIETAQCPFHHFRRPAHRAGLLRRPGDHAEYRRPGQSRRAIRSGVLPVSPVQSIAQLANDGPIPDHHRHLGQPRLFRRCPSRFRQFAKILQRAWLHDAAQRQDFSRRHRRRGGMDRRRRGAGIGGEDVADSDAKPAGKQSQLESPQSPQGKGDSKKAVPARRAQLTKRSSPIGSLCCPGTEAILATRELPIGRLNTCANRKPAASRFSSAADS